mgnify:CR=1 FL=1
MAKIKVSELRKLNKSIEKVIQLKYNGLNIEVKKYLPFQEKLSLATSIYKMSLNDVELILIDRNAREIAKVYLITQYYTNISLPKDVLEAYNLLMSTGVYEVITKQIPDEIIMIDMMVDNIEKYHEEKYRKESDIKNTLRRMIENTPTPEELKKFIEEASEELKNFDSNKLSFVTEFLNQVNGDEANGHKKS